MDADTSRKHRPLLVQIALPSTIERVDEDAAVLRALRQVVDGLRQGYAALQGLDARRTPTDQTQNPAPIGELPLKIPLNSLPLKVRAHGRAPLQHEGVGSPILTTLGRLDDDRLQTFQLDWTEDGPHFVVAGAPGTGKTNLLQAAVLSAAGIQSPQALRVLLVDFSGRSLRALESLKHVVARVTDVTTLDAQLTLLEAAVADAQTATCAYRHRD